MDMSSRAWSYADVAAHVADHPRRIRYPALYLLSRPTRDPVVKSVVLVYAAALALDLGSRDTTLTLAKHGTGVPDCSLRPRRPAQPSPWLQQRIDAAGADMGPAVARRVNEAADAVMPLRPPSALATQLLQYLQPASSTERRMDVRNLNLRA